MSRQGLADKLLLWVLTPAPSSKSVLGRAEQAPVEDNEKAPKHCLERQTPHQDKREAGHAPLQDPDLPLLVFLPGGRAQRASVEEAEGR